MSFAKLLFVAAFLCLWALPTNTQVADTGYTVGDVISDFAEELGIERFRDSVNSYSLIEQLRVPENPFTVFALDNESWDQNQNQIDILGGRNQLQDFLSNLIVRGEYSANNFTNDQILNTTLEGGWLRVNVYPNGTFLNGALRLVDEYDNATNGIVHIVRGFLLPTTSSFGDSDQTIASYLEGNALNSLLIAAITQAGLFDTLDNSTFGDDNSYTLFAPTDDAITNSGVDLALLLAPQNAAALRDLILNHVVRGTYFLSGLDDGLVLSTLLPGSTLVVSDNGGVISVNNVSVTDERIKRNGVIHEIDELLIPEGFVLVPLLPTSPQPEPTPQPEFEQPEPQPQPEDQPQPEPEPQPQPDVDQPQPEPTPQPEFEQPQPEPEPQFEQPEPQPSPEDEQPEPQPSPQPPAGNSTFCYKINSCEECQKHPNECSYCSIPPTNTQPYKGRCVPKPVSITNQQTCQRLNGAYAAQGQCPHVKQPCTSYTTCTGCVAEPQCFYCSYGFRRGCYSKSSTQDVQTCLSVGQLINDNCPFA